MKIRILLVLVKIGISATVSGAGAETLLLSDFESSPGESWVNRVKPEKPPFAAETNPEKVKVGSSSAKWERLDRNKWIALKNCPADWSRYEALSFWLCAETANGQKLNITVNTPSRSGETNARDGYYHYQITVDWTGWRQILIPFAEFKPNNKPKGWGEIKSLNLSSDGWKAEPLPDSVLYLDQMELVNR